MSSRAWTNLPCLATLFAFVLLGAAACDDEPPPGPSGRDADIDADEDHPADGGLIADADDVTGGGADADGDGDMAPLDMAEESADGFVGGCDELCANGVDDDEDGLTDCADPGCLSCSQCCDSLDRPWILGDFRNCTSLEECRWTSFEGRGDVHAVELGEAGLLLGGDGVGEVGVVASQEVGLTGEPTITFVSALDSDLCTPAACWQVLGVALTAQPDLTAGTGVEPHVGLVLDGEQRTVHAWVGGRLVRTDDVDLDVLTERRLHGFRVNVDGTVSFWVGLDPAYDGPPDRLVQPAAFTSSDRVSLRTQGLRAVVFGRLRGDAAAVVEDVRMSRLVCDVPDAWARLLPYPVVPTRRMLDRVASPSVVETGGGRLLMVFDAGGTLEAAESFDFGRSWERLGALELAQARTPYGRVARRSPALLSWGPQGEPRRLHLWFECEAEADESTPEGVTPTAICHAVSDDGVSWEAPEESAVAITGDSSQPWRAEVGDPTVLETAQGNLTMWFIGRSPVTGVTSILSATSSDGKVWAPFDEVQLDNVEGATSFERDSLAEPAVILRGGVYHMWYVGSNGSRTTLGYALSGEGRHWTRWGPVFEPALAWEANRVGAPSVLSFTDDAGGFETLHLWYEGGPRGRERVGLAIRDVPRR